MAPGSTDHRRPLLAGAGGLSRPRRGFVAVDDGGWFDRAVTAGVLLLIAVTPFAMGAVHPWAYIAVEVTVFAMTVAWMAKIALRPPIAHQPAFARLAWIAIPLGLFIGFVAIQIIPLPPAVERVVSPATYNLYVKALSGWPQSAPFEAMLNLPEVKPPANAGRVLPTPWEVSGGAKVPAVKDAPASNVSAERTEAAQGWTMRWRPLSVSPSQTEELLLKLVAYCALFALVLLYPFGPSFHGDAEKRFFRYVLVAVLATGLAVACVGILERVFWNGKVLWMFVPYDWGTAQPGLIERARGPFVNPDHFGAYLNLVLPIAIAGVMFPTFVVRRNAEPFRVFCAVVVLIVSVALLLSLSRAGWIGALVGFATVLWLAGFIPLEQRPALLRFPRRIAIPMCLAAIALVVATTTLFVSPEARHQADARLKETISQHQTLRFRVGVWRDSMPMVRDFPLFGTGLGSFEDVFPHYRTPPWNENYAREAHNDYLELLTGGGIIGSGLLLWFFAAIGTRLYRGLKQLPPEVLPVAAALLSAMAAMAFQEFFDFNLQIPANAALFTILMALVMRLIAAQRLETASADVKPRRKYALAVSAAAAILSVAAVAQGKIPYPYDLKQPSTPAQARSMILAHPASSRAHYWMVEALDGRLTPAMRARQMETAVWFDEDNPYMIDRYAQSLVWDGRQAEAMEQVARSVYVSPVLWTHYYLQWRLIPWLSGQERAAVERGFQDAVASDFINAVWGYGAFLSALDDHRREADLFAHAASSDRDASARQELLIASGRAYARAGDLDRAESRLKEAAALDPTSPDAYADLATIVYAPRRDFTAARAVVNEGISRCADPFALYLALAGAAETAGNQAQQESALLDAINARPSDYDTVGRLASLYVAEKRFDRAVLWMHRATDIRPDSAEAFYRLGLAEEAGYQYFAADRDFSRALALAPQDAGIKAHYQDFQKRLASGALRDAELSSPPGLNPASTEP